MSPYKSSPKKKAKKGRAEAPSISAADVCASASQNVVAAALAKLGPIHGLGGVLDQSAGCDSTLLAGEQVSHVMEAWQYMGAAVRAVLCNAGDNAIHFAYYAQLRSALSIFAGSGIRVSLGKSFYLDEGGKRTNFQLPGKIGSRTHPLAWALWDEWVKTPFAQELMGKNMTIISGISLSQLAMIPASSGPLLGAWGYDLAQGARDHTARNAASYKAASRIASPVMDHSSVLLIRRMWTLLLDSGQGVQFDATLVRYFVERYLEGAAQPDEDGNVIDRAALLDRIIDMTSTSTGVPKSSLEEVFAVQADVKLFELAAAQTAGVGNIISRALFLVRVATLALGVGLKTGANEQCKAWLSSWLQSAGLFRPGEHESPADIAADYESALDDFDGVDMANLPASVWNRGVAQSSALLARPEGFVGWGLAL